MGFNSGFKGLNIKKKGCFLSKTNHFISSIRGYHISFRQPLLSEISPNLSWNVLRDRYLLQSFDDSLKLGIQLMK